VSTEPLPILPPQGTTVTVAEAITYAWSAMQQGAPQRALRLSEQILATKKATRSQVPWVQASLVIALNDHLVNRSAEAAERLYEVMKVTPRADLPMQLYLSILRERADQNTNGPNTPEKAGRIVLGLGTGRSGSTTLSYLLAAQPDTCFSHEHVPLIPWATQGGRRLDFHLQRMAILSRLFGCVADVSHWWLPKLEAVIRRFPELRAVVTRRDRQETIDSFLAIKAPGSAYKPINHWMVHDGSEYQHNAWDICYPKFDANSLPQALGMYWDDYYERAKKLVNRYPENVRIFDIEQLSDPAGQFEILEFCGYANGVSVTETRKNRGTTRDGRSFWKNPFT
jgi:hypothetical protein